MDNLFICVRSRNWTGEKNKCYIEKMESVAPTHQKKSFIGSAQSVWGPLGLYIGVFAISIAASGVIYIFHLAENIILVSNMSTDKQNMLSK
jgi:hypothetical protein